MFLGLASASPPGQWHHVWAIVTTNLLTGCRRLVQSGLTSSGCLYVCSSIYLSCVRILYTSCSLSLSPSNSRMPHRQLSRPRRTGFKMHQTPPIVEPSHTPTSHSQMPRPAAPPQQAAGILVVYDIVEMPAQDSKRTPFIKKHHSSTVTLGEFKEKIFNRKGEYRYVYTLSV